MISQEDLSRGVVNHRVNRIKRVFNWAVSEELIPPSVADGLRSVTGLRFGRTEARETEPILPVADEVVEATLPFVAPQIESMIKLQRLHTTQSMLSSSTAIPSAEATANSASMLCFPAFSRS